MNFVETAVSELDGAQRSLRRTRAIREIKSANTNGKAIVLLGGYASIPNMYATAQLILEEEGCRPYIMDVSGRFDDACEKVAHFLESSEFYESEQVVLAGHSLGGGIAARLLIDPRMRRFIEHIYLLGTPLLGTPLKALARLVRFTAHVSSDTFVPHRTAFIDASERVTAYVGGRDGVAPRERCVIPQSRMRVVDLPYFTHLDFLNDPDLWRDIGQTVRG
jgi:alpha-beta hydrolase superfamily lysophospholipase